MKKSLAEASTTSSTFCLERKDDTYNLKLGQDYRYQIQCQLYFSASSNVLPGIGVILYRERRRTYTLNVLTWTKDGGDYS